MHMPSFIAQVVLNLPLAQPFDYCAGEVRPMHVGCRVRVQFGQVERVGIVVDVRQIDTPAEIPLKSILQRLDEQPIFSPELFDLLRFCSSYYHYPLGQVLFSALPSTLRTGKSTSLRQTIHWQLSAYGEQEGLKIPQRAKTQLSLYTRLCKGSLAENSPDLSTHARSTLKQWATQGWLTASSAEPVPVLAETTSIAPTLNHAQMLAVARIQASLGCYESFLLHGVTGSGKTEIYLNLTQQVIQRGGQVLLLVPEIHLTPQLTQQFTRRFGAEYVATLHSGMTDTQRLKHWLAAQSGRAKIVLGTRLAGFAPMPKLQMIVVDEEHDHGFHQQEGLRYSARDIAVVRAQRLKIPIVLGSATPALESWYNTLTGRYQRISLTERATAITMPTVRLIDSRAQKPLEGVTSTLLSALQANLAQGQQSLLFINRRGYAPALFCSDCGWAAGCSRCSAKLVIHLSAKSLRCHHCGEQQCLPVVCPKCDSKDLYPAGVGTQRLEQYLHTHFPTARILRVDRDSTQGESRWLSMQQTIRQREVDILVGTQLLSKGHDFPGITLVGIIGADDALYSTDFRATERLFAQLMQVGGRAGRARHVGEVLIQTRFPDHPLYQALQQHDYQQYAQLLLAERQLAHLPPYYHLAALRADATNGLDALVFLEKAQQLAPSMDGVILFDPTPDIMPRKANRERALLLVQSGQRALLQRYLNEWMPKLHGVRVKQVRWHLDVDPQQL